MLDLDTPSTETFIPTIMAMSKCDKHSAEENEPCYVVDLHLRGICNARAKKAGFNHPISESPKLNHGGSNTRRKSR